MKIPIMNNLQKSYRTETNINENKKEDNAQLNIFYDEKSLLEQPLLSPISQNKDILSYEEYKNWNFKNLNILFGTDAKPFISFISKNCEFITIGAKMNLKLFNHQSIIRLSDNEILFAGGVNHLFNHVTSKSFIFDIQKNKKKSLGSLIYRRFFSNLIKVRNRIFIIGGRDYGQDREAILNKCEELELSTGKWTVKSDLNLPRCNFSHVIYKNEVYIFGGITKDSTLLSEIETYNFKKERWEIIGLKLNPGIYGNLSFVINEEIYVLGGEKNVNNGYYFNINLKNGSDLGSIIKCNSIYKNTLSKPIILNNKIMILGGFLTNGFCFDLNSKNLKYVFSNKQEKNLINHLQKITFESFNLTRCSYVIPKNNYS